MISLSASSIQDFMECRKKYYYRRFAPEEAVPNKYLVIGKIVHQVIEEGWNKNPKYLEARANDLARKESMLSRRDVDEINSFLLTFNQYFSRLLSNEDRVEQFFKFKYEEYPDVFLTGKMDRILPGGTLIDWKTTRNPPATINNDVQFMIYNYAYKKLYNSQPTNIYYAALINGTLIRYDPESELEWTLFNEVIPQMIKEIKLGQYPRDGLFKESRTCHFCSYRDICFKELRNEIRR